MIVLTRTEVRGLLDFNALLEALSGAMAELSSGSVSLPQRIAAFVPEEEAVLGAMPVYLPSSKTLGAKLVTIFPKNAERNEETHQALIALFDAATGHPLALMDGSEITAVRTAAGSALATRLLARSDAHVLAVLGTGIQARAHARVIPLVCPIDHILIAGRILEKAHRLAQEISVEVGLKVDPVESYEEAVRHADVICTATHSPQPVLYRTWVKAGAHINSVGFNPAGQELDPQLVADTILVVESRPASLAPFPSGSNDLIWAIRDGLITQDRIREVGELISGSRQGRTSSEQITLYKSVGVAVQDAVAANLVFNAARKQAVGTEVEL